MAVARPRARLGMVLHREHRPVLAGEALVAAVEQRHMGHPHARRQRCSSTAKPWFWLVISTCRWSGPSPAGWRRDGRAPACRSARPAPAPATGARGRCRTPAPPPPAPPWIAGTAYSPGRRRVARAVGEEHPVRPMAQDVLGASRSPAPPSPGSRPRPGCAGCCAWRRNPPPRRGASARSAGRSRPARPSASGPTRSSACRRPAARGPSLPAPARPAPARPARRCRTARRPETPARPFGAPPSRMRTVSARVSTPPTPVTPCARSQGAGARPPASCWARSTSCFTTSPQRGDGGRLDVLGVDADIADMREGEGDDLPGIGRVGQRLLVAGHAGVEADLAAPAVVGMGAEAAPPEHGAVAQHEGGGGAGGRLGRVGHGGLAVARVAASRPAGAGNGVQRQAGGLDQRRPVPGGNGAALPPLAHRLGADAQQPRRRLRAAQAVDDVVHAVPWRQLYGKFFPTATPLATCWEISSQAAAATRCLYIEGRYVPEDGGDGVARAVHRAVEGGHAGRRRAARLHAAHDHGAS